MARNNSKAMAFPDRAVASGDNPSAPAAGAAPARHRLSVLFCVLCDSTALSGSLEAEDYAALLSALRRIYDEAVTRHGGTVVRILGDGLLAVFGYPVPSEGDGRRAVLAALQMHEAVKRIAPPRGALGAPGRPAARARGRRACACTAASTPAWCWCKAATMSSGGWS
jgi:class 3 adenylate cyclase